LIKEVKPAAKIVEEMVEEAVEILTQKIPAEITIK